MKLFRKNVVIIGKQQKHFDYYTIQSHCVKSVQIRSFFWSVFFFIRTELRRFIPVFSPNTGKYGPEITPYLDTFHAVNGKGLLVSAV